MKYKKFSSVRTNTMRTNQSGYKVFTDRNGKTQSVHKRVAEKKVGGKIFSGHEVHHKNGNKLDNRPQNLQVLKIADHKKLHANIKQKVAKATGRNR
jgi:hypothetical protein